VRFVARRHHLAPDEAEDLSAAVKVKLLEDDYAVLRKFEGRSSVRTYLTTVVARCFLDSRTERWGRWRPSAQARRLGAVAVLLDRLLTRDGVAFDEACERLRANHGVPLSRGELEAIRVQLPSRVGRRFVDESEIRERAAEGTAEEEALDVAAHLSEADRVEAALGSAVAALPPEDRLLLRMKFQDNLQVSRIAQLLGLDQKPLYRRLEQVMKVLRGELEARGIQRDRVLDILGHPAFDPAPVFDLLPGGRASMGQSR
jgi:RNA polymerase sigma factor for flagellar operon FliA